MNENGLLNTGIPASLKDIVESTDTSSVFLRYRDHEFVGKNIFKELYKRFITVNGRRGFRMGDDSREIGILSQCQSLQAMLLLASEFKLRFDDSHIISETKENLTIREVMDIVVEDVLEQIKTDREGVYRFDASPYETNLFTVEYSNIDIFSCSFLENGIIEEMLQHHFGKDVRINLTARGSKHAVEVQQHSRQSRLARDNSWRTNLL